MNSLLQTVKKNHEGSDYICSDIHGHFSLLQSTLNALGFNPQKDRLFSLGDLIDRGPENEQTFEWLEKDWFFAIQGNHERMLINAVEQKSARLFAQWSMWGGSWAESLGVEELRAFHKKLSKLPVAIELPVDNNKTVALVHAELPDQCDWLEVRSQLLQFQAEEIESTPSISDMLWKKTQLFRTPERQKRIQPVRNIHHVFHGHSIVESITTIGNRTFMDLGSYATGKIAVIDPTKQLANG